MTSKKRHKRQLQRWRRIEANNNATASEIDDENRNSNNSKMRGGTKPVRNKPKTEARKNNIAVHSLAGSVWPWASTWARKRVSRSTVISDDSSFPTAKPTATSATMVIVLVLLVSLVVGNLEYLRQTIATAINSASSSTFIVIIICATLSVSLVLPFLIWWIVINASRFGDEKNPSDDEVQNVPGITNDEFATIRPLGLKGPSKKVTMCANNNGFDGEQGIVAPQLATSEYVRTKLAEWLPFGLRYTSDLNLVFSTRVHGRSLQTLYHNLWKTSSSHTIILLEAFVPRSTGTGTSPHLVGMYTSQKWHSSPKLYGDGRCFLFRLLLPENREVDSTNDEKAALRSECWNWTPPLFPSCHLSTSKCHHNSNHADNSHSENALSQTFQRSNHNLLSLGISASGVGAGLQLNHDMTVGESHRAVGFDNEPLVGGSCFFQNRAKKTSGVVFDVGLVEVYQLVREIDGLPIK